MLAQNNLCGYEFLKLLSLSVLKESLSFLFANGFFVLSLLKCILLYCMISYGFMCFYFAVFPSNVHDKISLRVTRHCDIQGLWWVFMENRVVCILTVWTKTYLHYWMIWFFFWSQCKRWWYLTCGNPEFRALQSSNFSRINLHGHKRE